MGRGWKLKEFVVFAALAGSMLVSESPSWSLVTTARAAEAGVCTNAMGKNRKRCRIDVKVVDDGGDSCKITVDDADQASLQLNEQSNIRIIWLLNGGSGDYLFCRQTGDGVFLKQPIRQEDGQVLTMRVMKTKDSDDNDTEDEFSCSPRFRWTFRNDLDPLFPRGTEYKYNILVRSRNFARKCSFDPFIKNG